MTEQTRSIRITVEVETNKRSIRESFTLPATAIAWLRASGYLEDDWRGKILDVLGEHHGELGVPEDALEVVLRLSRFWREGHS